MDPRPFWVKADDTPAYLLSDAKGFPNIYCSRALINSGLETHLLPTFFGSLILFVILQKYIQITSIHYLQCLLNLLHKLLHLGVQSYRPTITINCPFIVLQTTTPSKFEIHLFNSFPHVLDSCQHKKELANSGATSVGGVSASTTLSCRFENFIDLVSTYCFLVQKYM